MTSKFQLIPIVILLILTSILPVTFSPSVRTTTTYEQTQIQQASHPQISLQTQPPLYVDQQNTLGPWDGTPQHPYQHIHDAITNATSFDTIIILPGTYQEKLSINKSLSLIGEHTQNTIVDGAYEPVIISITADQVTLSNLTIRNSGGYQQNAGILINADQTIISNCTIYRTKTGIYVNQSTNTFIQDCEFYSNGEGVYLNSSHNCQIIDSCFTHNGLGINFQRSTLNTIQGCYAQTNGIGFFLNNSRNCTIEHSASYNNNDNQQGIYLGFCQNITIVNCNLLHNGVGCRIGNSSFITISYCDLMWNTHFGVKTEKNTHDITISSCEITQNLRFGVYMELQSTCTISYSNIYHNLFGIYVDSSQCTAQNNWWGSRLGPDHFERISEQTLRDTVRSKHGKIQIFPWMTTKNSHAGSLWTIDPSRCPDQQNDSRYATLPLQGNDSDGDGAPNWWETKYGYDPHHWDDHTHLDPDHDGLNNLEECYTDQWGSNPFKKDLFLEMDWMPSKGPGSPSNKPSAALISQVQTLFSQQGITLHVDIGNMGGGEEIPYKAHFSYADLRDIYWNYFLHHDLNNPRKGIFHYAIICDYGPGSGFTFFGWDSLDSFCISAQTIQDKQPKFQRDVLIVGGSVHELGHTLSVIADVYGGVDNMITIMDFTQQQIKYVHYKSCMNYFYTYKTLGYSDGSHGRGDFNDWAHLDLSFFKHTSFKWPQIPEQ